jgi:LSD1 subclass zinc finger protein
MTDSSVATQIQCGQCGAVLPVEAGTQFVTCAFCGTTSFVDKTRAVLHYAVRVTVRENDALAALRRWMAGNFPMWMVRVLQGERERVFFKPAAALSVSELERVNVPAADLEPYDHGLDATAVPPTVPYETMRQWLADDRSVGPEAIREVSLVHLPIYTCKYGFDGRRYTAIVDAATSEVFANIYPSKWEVPYLAIGAAAFVAYFCAALIPLIGYLSGEGAGLATGILVYGVVAIVLAIPIFVAAMMISAKV